MHKVSPLLMLGFLFLILLWANIGRILCAIRDFPQQFTPQKMKHVKVDSVVEEIPLDLVQRASPKVRLVPLNDTLKFVMDELEKPNVSKKGMISSSHLPSALIIGIKKCGTRALLEFLRIHPDIRAAGSEVHFFDHFYEKGFHWYRHRMPQTFEGQVTIEKTPSYFITNEVPRRVQLMNPGIKLIVVVRNPVTRAISDYTQVRSKHRKMPTFEDMAFVNGSKVVDMTWIPLKIGLYTKFLEQWLQYFPLSQFLFVSGERLISDPVFEITRAQDFLGLKKIISKKHFFFNSTKGFPCLLKSENHRMVIHCLGKNKGRHHPPIDPTAIQRLEDFYRPFNQRFYQQTGMNFGW